MIFDNLLIKPNMSIYIHFKFLLSEKYTVFVIEVLIINSQSTICACVSPTSKEPLMYIPITEIRKVHSVINGILGQKNKFRDNAHINN